MEVEANMIIDFVMIWVDGADPQWLKEKNKYLGLKETESKENLYRDWDNLQYWFRGVEKFAPWVHRIHFVTCGHVPSWLNTNHPKLNIIQHSDYIPAEYLPTFSSHPIELNLHRIKGLSEKFVYFNDDTFLMDHTNPKDFFENELPCDSSIMSALIPSVKNDIFFHILANNLSVINHDFTKFEVMKNNLLKWLNIKYGKYLLKNLYYAPIRRFTGFHNFHLPAAFLKSTFEKVWENEYDILNATSMRKFRTIQDVNQYIFSYWQFATGKYMPRRADVGRFFTIGENNADLYDAMVSKKYKMICMNDSVSDIDFEKEKTMLQDQFEMLLPNRSDYEV
jgi:hypothetical protein